MTEQPTLAELDRLAEPLHARVVTKEAMETMTRLAYEKGLADATHAALASLPPSAPPALDVEQAYFDGYKEGMANEVDDWNKPDETLRQFAAEYARLQEPER